MWLFTTWALAQERTHPPCMAYAEDLLGRKQFVVRVADDLVFPEYGAWPGGSPPPMFALSDDGTAAYMLHGKLFRAHDVHETRQVALLDPETLEIRRPDQEVIGGVDLERREAWLGQRVVHLDGSCSASDGLLAVLGVDRVRMGPWRINPILW